jgi:hypothetical protein
MKPKFKIGQKAFIVKSPPPKNCVYGYEKYREEWAKITLSNAVGGYLPTGYSSLKIKYNTPVIVKDYSHVEFHGSYVVEYVLNDCISLEFDIDEYNLSRKMV